MLDADQRRLLVAARRAILATQRPDGTARLVPVCYALLDTDAGARVVSPLDAKPKAVRDVRRLARVRDIRQRPEVVLLVDRWSEDWSRLAWLRMEGRAELVEPNGTLQAAAIEALRERYPQYREMDLEHAPLIVIEPSAVQAWHAATSEGGGP
jgi:PPOX class probable F420-dependent enzyme